MVFNVRVFFLRLYSIKCQQLCSGMGFLCSSVIYEFLLSKACSHSDLLSTRGPEKARRKADARKEEKEEPNPPSRASLFCLVMNSQPRLFFWIRTALFGPDWSLPPYTHTHIHTFSSLGNKRAACSSVFSVFSKIQLQKSSQTCRRQLCFCSKHGCSSTHTHRHGRTFFSSALL